LAGLFLALVLALGILVGFGAGRRYYHTHVGDWRIGVTAVGIAVGIALGTASTVVLVAWLMQSEQAIARARRMVIHTVALTLAVGGALAGAGAGYAYASAGGGRVVAAVFVGIGSALGAWLAAALLGLLVEIANSLRQLAARSTIANGTVAGALALDREAAE
jgi:hypothetical protein